jgi:hypothetical protein
MKKYSAILIGCATRCFLLAQCSTGLGPIDTTLTVYVNVQTKTNPDADTVYRAEWLPFYVYGDTTQYRLLSYENALAGRLSSRLDHGAVEQGIAAQVLDTTRVVFPNLNQKSVILWIVQPEFEVYAWRQIDLPDGLPTMGMRLFFRMWEEERSYIDNNKWHIELPPKAEKPEDPDPEDPDPEDPDLENPGDGEQDPQSE